MDIQSLNRVLPTGSGPEAGSVPAGGEEAELRAAARQFESLFLEMMLRSMRDASLGDPMFGGGEMETYRDMHDREVARSMTAGSGLGLADLMVGQLRRSDLAGAVDAEPAESVPNRSRP